MSLSLNTVTVAGNLTKDPEIKYTPSGAAVLNMSIANNQTYVKDGEKKQEVSFFDVVVWGKSAENCNQYLTKGAGVIVEGSLRQDRWEHEGKTLSRIKINVSRVHFMPKKEQAVSKFGPNDSALNSGWGE